MNSSAWLNWFHTDELLLLQLTDDQCEEFCLSAAHHNQSFCLLVLTPDQSPPPLGHSSGRASWTPAQVCWVPVRRKNTTLRC